jgi:hypothetical protein
VSSGAQRELSPHFHDEQKDRPRARDRDGAIELCFQLLSSGRRLDEVLAEIAPAGGGSGGNILGLEGAVDATTRPIVPTISELLIEKAGQARAGRLPERDVGLPQPPDATSAMPSDDVASAARSWPLINGAKALGARLPMMSLGLIPQVRGGIGAPVHAGGGGWFESEGRRGAVHRLGFLAIFGALLAAVSIVAFGLLRLPSGPPTIAEQRPSTASSAKQSAATAASPYPLPRGRGQGEGDGAGQANPTPAAKTAAAARPTSAAPAPQAAPAETAPLPLHLADAVRREAAPPPASQDAVAMQRMTAAPPKAAGVADRAAAAAAFATTAAGLAVHPAVMRSAVPGSEIQREASALSGGEVRTLMSRGDALLATGDVTSARLFYRRGADGGNGAAALRLGETFDPAFLEQAGLGQVAGDPKNAAFWYSRAHDLGDRDADLLLKSIEPSRP